MIKLSGKWFAFLFISGTLFLSACDPGVEYERVVVNNSTYDIWIYRDSLQIFPDAIPDSILIPANSSRIIANFTGIGRTSEFKNCGLPDSMIRAVVVSPMPKEITKNLTIQTSWQYKTLDRWPAGGGECECRFEIDSSDIQ